MSEELYHAESRKTTLYAWGLWQMLRGAGWAALLFVGLIVCALVLLGVAKLLPENPNAAIEAVRTLTAFV